MRACREIISKAEDWEINKKKIFEECLKNKTAPFHWSSTCVENPDWIDAGEGGTVCTSMRDQKYVFCSTCRTVISNEYGDLKPHNCEGQQTFEAERKANFFKYLKENEIKSISLQEEGVLIEYNNGNSETKQQLTKELQEIKGFLLRSPTKTVETTELLNNMAIAKENKQKANDKKTMLTIGGVIILLVISSLSIWWFVSRKKRNKL